MHLETATQHLPVTDATRLTNGHALYMMAAALGLRDRYTQEHAQRVGAYSGRLAGRLGLPHDEVVSITYGGMLHDIGKLGLSDRIFSNECTALSREMMTEVHRHPIIGAALLKSIKCDDNICDYVLYHHERIDGSGYPFGLKAESIPLGARIVSIADCFDAITSDRPYQKRKNRGTAFTVLNEMAGTCLDAELVTLFISEIREKGMIGDLRVTGL